MFNMKPTVVKVEGQYECNETESLVKLCIDLMSTKLERTGVKEEIFPY